MKLALGRILLALRLLEKTEGQELPIVTAFWYNLQLDKLKPFIDRFNTSLQVIRDKHTKDGVIDETLFREDVDKLLLEEFEVDIEQRPAEYFSTIRGFTRDEYNVISFLFNKER